MDYCCSRNSDLAFFNDPERPTWLAMQTANKGQEQRTIHGFFVTVFWFSFEFGSPGLGQTSHSLCLQPEHIISVYSDMSLVTCGRDIDADSPGRDRCATTTIRIALTTCLEKMAWSARFVPMNPFRSPASSLLRRCSATALLGPGGRQNSG